MPLSFTDAEIQAKAEQLGLVDAGTPLPRNQRSRVVAALAAEKRRPAQQAEVPIAQSIVIEPGGEVTVDDKPFPWVLQAERMEVTLSPDGAGMVRLTMPALNIQIRKPNIPESENRA
ncbi:hypothetical protein ABZ916_39115 [Streptomyces sp. NPDC046853]|uniref:hypothetical protein n=1 Tax=Streptomyces sp. NPDC046853 TaxID=3154920 RepID=UPI0033EFE937